MSRLGGLDSWIALAAVGVVVFTVSTSDSAEQPYPSDPPGSLQVLLAGHKDVHAETHFDQDTRGLTVYLAGDIDDPSTRAGRLAAWIWALDSPKIDAVVQVPYSEQDFEAATTPLLVARSSPEPALPQFGSISRDVIRGQLVMGVLKEDLPRWQQFTQEFESTIPIRLQVERDMPRAEPDQALAVWRLAAGQELIPASTGFTALVSRLECNNGITGTVNQPDVRFSAGQVVVTFHVSPGRSGATSCPGNREVPYEVELPEPIGSRSLIDGACETSEAATTAFCSSSNGLRYPADANDWFGLDLGASAAASPDVPD